MEMQRVSAAQNARRYGVASLAALAAPCWANFSPRPSTARTPITQFGRRWFFRRGIAALSFHPYRRLSSDRNLVLVSSSGRFFSTGESARKHLCMVGFFIVFSGFIVALGEANRRSLARSRWAEEQLRSAHADLEKRVQDRTAELSAANESLGNSPANYNNCGMKNENKLPANCTTVLDSSTRGFEHERCRSAGPGPQTRSCSCLRSV